MGRPTHFERPRVRLLVGINSRARRGSGARDRTLAALRARGHETVLLESDPDPQRFSASIAAHRGRVDAVVLGGGDGTLVSAVAGIRALDVPLAIVPLGTVNELARTLRIPFGIEAACALVDLGTRRRIDVGTVNGRYYLNEASIGLSNAVARAQTADVKERFGMLSIAIATARALRSMQPHSYVVDDGERKHVFKSVQLTVANSHRFGGVVEVPGARIDDGTLNLYSIDVANWWDACAVVAAVAVRRFTSVAPVTGLSGPRFRVTSKHSHRVYTDGEEATRTPAEFAVVRGALDVFVPMR